mmetsp:Transcript_9153/g.22776  ORF Transcript_9153/g.22776 Transcript_9153/m.22776 type:complete len:279 (-) Transcript_9153:437-1273(-)
MGRAVRAVLHPLCEVRKGVELHLVQVRLAVRDLRQFEAVRRVRPGEVRNRVLVPWGAHHAIRVRVLGVVVRLHALGDGSVGPPARGHHVVCVGGLRGPKPFVVPHLRLAEGGDRMVGLGHGLALNRVVPVRQRHVWVHGLQHALEPLRQSRVRHEEAVPVMHVVAVRVARQRVVNADERVNTFELFAVEGFAVRARRVPDRLHRVEEPPPVVIRQRAEFPPHVPAAHRALRAGDNLEAVAGFHLDVYLVVTHFEKCVGYSFAAQGHVGAVDGPLVVVL